MISEPKTNPYSLVRIIAIVKRALDPNKHRLIARTLKEQKPQTAAEYFQKKRVTRIQLSDSTVKDVPK